MPHSEAGLLWDGIVFACLLLQLRFFSSHYFQHLVLETRAQQMLASRSVPRHCVTDTSALAGTPAQLLSQYAYLINLLLWSIMLKFRKYGL